MELAAVVEASSNLTHTRSRKKKLSILGQVLAAAHGPERLVATALLAGELPTGRIGVGPKMVYSLAPDTHADASQLMLADVVDALSEVGATRGSGSQARKRGLLEALLARCTEAEADFLRRLLSGGLRQGALDGLVAQAVAATTGIESRWVSRALMLSGDLVQTAALAFERGEAALRAVDLELFRPVLPMLGNPAADARAAMERIGGEGGQVSAEYKLDGARIQVHKQGERVAVYTRQLRDVTRSVPDLVEAVRMLSAETLILDGEAIALDDGGRPLPFQTIMRRFGRVHDVEKLRVSIPLVPAFFDCLYADGVSFIDSPGIERRAALESIVAAPWRVQRMVAETAEQIDAFMAASLDAGHEGVMVKALDRPYDAGARSSGWLKLKSIHTVELVVLAAEWGSGRRRGWLSNLHLGARAADGSFVMVGKTFKGLTDEVLAWQTDALQERAMKRDDHVVWVRPELVVEVAFNDVQESPHYPGGIALRFARVRGYRPDKAPSESEPLGALRALLPESLRKPETGS